MYRFQRNFDLQQAKLQLEANGKEREATCSKSLTGNGLVVGKEANGNLSNTLEAIVLANDPKAHSNGILTQIIVRPEANCDLNHGLNGKGQLSVSAKQGFDNQAFQTDELANKSSNSNDSNNNNNNNISNNSNSSCNNNTHL